MLDTCVTSPSHPRSRSIGLSVVLLALVSIFGVSSANAAIGFEQTVNLIQGESYSLHIKVANCVEYMGGGYGHPSYQDESATYSGNTCDVNIYGTVPNDASYTRWEFRYNTAGGKYTQLTASITYSIKKKLVFRSKTLTTGRVDKTYSTTLSASGGTGSYSFALASGALPDGVSLNGSTGVISGTPTKEGDYDFSVTLSDTGISGAEKTANFSIEVEPAIPVASGSSDTVKANSDANALALNLSGAAATSLVVTTVPSHGSWSSSGNRLYYTPTAGYSGSDSISYYAVNANGQSGTVKVAITVSKPTLSLAVSTDKVATVGLAYSATFTASLGTADYTYEISAGALPAGLSMSSGGVLSGTPTDDGTANFTVKASDVYGAVGTAAYTLTVGRPDISLSPTTLPKVTAAGEASATFKASGGVAPYTYAVTAGALPKGLKLSSAGTVSGTATYAGKYTFSITATDSYNSKKTQSYSVTVEQATLTLDPQTLPEGTLARAYSQKLAVKGGIGPYTLTMSSGALPDGIVYDAASKTLSGTPKVFGASTLTFALADATGSKASVTVDFTVSDLPDPTKDAEVTGLVTAQTRTVRRFARQQMENVSGHMRDLHDRSGGVRSRFGASVTYNRDSRKTASSSAPGDVAVPAAGGFISTHGDAADDVNFTDSFAKFSGGRAALWTAGSVDFGARTLGGNDSEVDHVSVAVTAGLDYRVTRSLIAGLAIGINRNHTRVSENGTETDGKGASVTGYASWQALPGFFLDGLAGYGLVSFDNTRFVTQTGDLASGDRDGRQAFAAITATYEGEYAGLSLAPYGRLQSSRSWLDGYRENGGGAYNLAYGDETVDSLTGALGLTISRMFVTGEGAVTPRLKLEYGHEFADATDLSLSYLESPTRYTLSEDEEEKDFGTIGLGADLVTLDEATRLSLDYAVSFDADGVRNQPIRFRFTHRF